MTDLIERLRDADPATGIAAYDDLTVARNLAALTADASPAPRRAPRWIVAAAASLALGGLVLAQVLTPTPTTAAAEVLNRTAAAVPADPAARPDQYWKVQTTGTERFTVGERNGDVEWRARAVRTDYVAVDGNRPNWFVTGYTGATVVDGPADAFFPGQDRAYSWNLTDNELPRIFRYPTPAFLATLPIEPDALAAVLRAEAERERPGLTGAEADGAVLSVVQRILESGRAPADLTAALLRTVATLPGLELEQDAEILGVRGVAVSHVDAFGIKAELLLDPDAGRILGVRITATRDVDTGGPDAVVSLAGQVISEHLVSRELVDAVPAEIVRTGMVLNCRYESADNSVRCDR